MRLERQLRYKALADIIVGGRLLFPKGAVFTMGEQFGAALVREGRAELLAVLEQPPDVYDRRDMRAENGKPGVGRHKRRDMRAKGGEK